MRTAVDIGGTFTDVLAVGDGGRLAVAKLPSRGRDLAASFRAGIEAVTADAPRTNGAGAEYLYGTTLALNALLTHRLPRVGLVVTAGFRELLETARLPATDAADHAPPPPRLVPLERVREITARTDADGTVRTPVDPEEVAAIARGFRDDDVQAVAVALLHSYASDAQEREVAAVFAREAPNVTVVCSSAVLPELREYERTLATCLTACLVPPMRGHLEACVPGGSDAPLLVMKSSGGLASARRTLERPLGTALSGPSAAVVGMAWLGRQLARDKLITFDVGGTSTDVALVRDGEPALTTEGAIAGYPLRLPMIDVHTVGAGGGSLASAGPDDRWRVGPESAGAVPGPVCYGQGATQPTLTDAQLVLGRLPDALLGGTLPLDRDAAVAALEAFGAARGLDAARTAHGLLAIATHNMCGAVRRVSVLRGHDPADYTLVAIGGAGPLHAAELAELLGVREVLVPPQPGLAAPWGLLVADVREDFVRACGRAEDALDPEAMAADLAALREAADAFLDTEGFAPERRRLEGAADVRYAGMLYESRVPLAHPVTEAALRDAVDAFHADFERLTGHHHRGKEPVEFVNLRVSAVGARDAPPLLEHVAPQDGTPVARGEREVTFLHGDPAVTSAVFDRATLGAGAVVDGPAVIEQYESTLLVPPGWRAEVDPYGNALLHRPASPGDVTAPGNGRQSA